MNRTTGFYGLDPIKKGSSMDHQDTREQVLTFRVSFDQLDHLKRTAKNNGTTVSNVIREALEKQTTDINGPSPTLP